MKIKEFSLEEQQKEATAEMCGLAIAGRHDEGELILIGTTRDWERFSDEKYIRRLLEKKQSIEDVQGAGHTLNWNWNQIEQEFYNLFQQD